MESKKIKITKTLRLRIVRPFYGDILEKQIKEEKKRKGGEKDRAASQLPLQFWLDFKGNHPEIVLWGELRSVLSQLQKTIAPIYNKSSAILYKELLEEGKVKAKKGNEEAAIKYAVSKYVYPEIMNTIYNSYIALGMGEKLRASFSGEKLRKIKTAQVSSPSAKSDNFPISIWVQKTSDSGGFKITKYDGDFVLDVPFPEYRLKDEKEIEKYKPWEKVEFLDTTKKKHIQLLLSTLVRKRNKGWNRDWSVEDQIKKVMSGEYRVSKIEIAKGKRIAERNYWFINLVVNFEKPVKSLSSKISGGIDIGVSNPVVCAIHNKLNRLTIRDNDVMDFTKAEIARLRAQRKGDRFRRGGHGIKHKFTTSEAIQKRYEQRRKKKIEEWASRIVKFFENNGVGLVYIEEIEAKNIKEGGDFFSVQLRVAWPIREMLDLFKRKLIESGIKVQFKNPAFSSQICSKCGKWNQYFDFGYRVKNNFPSFKCKFCGYGVDEIKEIIFADYNAAKNLANPEFDEIVKREIPKEVREKYIKEELVAES